MTDSNTTIMSEEEYEELAEAPYKGKTPEQLAEIALGQGNHDPGMLVPITLAGVPSDPRHDDRFFRVGALTRLEKVDGEMAVKVAEILAPDQSLHRQVRMVAIHKLPKDKAEAILSKIAQDQQESPEMRHLALFGMRRGGTYLLPEDVRKTLAHKIVSNENDDPDLRARVRAFILEE